MKYPIETTKEALKQIREENDLNEGVSGKVFVVFQQEDYDAPRLIGVYNNIRSIENDIKKMIDVEDEDGFKSFKGSKFTIGEIASGEITDYKIIKGIKT